jgi:ABC-type nickel/cobalt efflux system permease component RcnA
MLHGDAFELLVGAFSLGALHGVEPGHGWPVAASYALDQSNKWLSGFAASFILGIGHLISSIAMVGVFFYAKSYFSLTQVNEPIQLAPGLMVGGPVSLVAGALLILLGLREYFGGPSHGHGEEEHEHDHEHSHEHNHSHDHGDNLSHEQSQRWWDRIKGLLPFGGGHSHDHGELDEAAERGLFGIAWFAFLLGFAHEEEFEIIALCAGSEHCVELMSAYALTVIFGIVSLTMVLVAGYQHYEDRVERYTPYLPAFSAAVLMVMGGGFITGLF